MYLAHVLEIGERNLVKFRAALSEPGELLVWATRNPPPRDCVPGATLIFMFAGEPQGISKLYKIEPPGKAVNGQWAQHYKLFHRKSDFIDLRNSRGNDSPAPPIVTNGKVPVDETLRGSGGNHFPRQGGKR